MRHRYKRSSYSVEPDPVLARVVVRGLPLNSDGFTKVERRSTCRRARYDRNFVFIRLVRREVISDSAEQDSEY